MKYTNTEEDAFNSIKKTMEIEGESKESLEIFDIQKDAYISLYRGTRLTYAIVDSPWIWKAICKEEFLEEDLEDARFAYENTAKFLYEKGLIEKRETDYEGLNAMQVHQKIMKLYYSLGVDGELGNYVISEDSISEFYGFIELCEKTFKK